MKWSILILFVAFCGISLAEMRVWEDRKGNVLEAEYKCEISGKVILRDAKGKDYSLPISSLSKKDQKYLQTKLPPKVKIDFKKWQDRKTTGYSSTTVQMRGEITITKTSRMAYEGDLKAVLFMIGEDSFEDEYVMMDRAEFKFDFKKLNKHTFEGEKFKMHQYKYSSNSDDGVEYRGYLVIIYDANDEILFLESSSEKLKEKADYLSKIKRGSRFSDKMKGDVERGSSDTYY